MNRTPLSRVLKGDFWPEGRTLLPAARLVPPPIRTLRAAKGLALAIVLFFVFAALAPWQQNISGSGRVIAFSPNDRPQEVQATISGRVVEWLVVEGDRVDEGDVLANLSDNDPDRVARLELQRDATRDRLEAYMSQVTAYEERLEAVRDAQTAEIRAAEAEIRVAREKLLAERETLAASEAALRTANIQRTRIEGLAAEGLSSQRELELAELSAANAQADYEASRAGVRAAQATLQTKQASLESKRASTEASIRSALAALRSAETQVATTRSSLAEVESRVAQQHAQVVRAPRDGVVQRILVQQGGMQVSRGETLAYLVPEVNARAVEVYVDGNDAALITEGRHVRLQFEGWPAVQFAGWSSAAVGTFGGEVAFVDPSDDGSGDFRVVVIPDQNDTPWPSTRYLRQGTRAKGWVLLEEVRVGFEIWRQLNGFPPSLENSPGIGDEDKDS